MRVIVTTILLVGIAFVLLGIRVLFVKGGKFPNGHIHASEAMRAKGITCASSQTKSKKTIIKPIHEQN